MFSSTRLSGIRDTDRDIEKKEEREKRGEKMEMERDEETEMERDEERGGGRVERERGEREGREKKREKLGRRGQLKEVNKRRKGRGWKSRE